VFLRHRYTQSLSANIPNGGTTSQPIRIMDMSRGSIRLPAAITGTTVSFEVSLDGTTFAALNVDPAGTARTVQTVAAAGRYTIPSEVFNYPFFRLLMGAQGAARTIDVYLKS